MEMAEILNYLERFVENTFAPQWVIYDKETTDKDLEELPTKLATPIYNYDGTPRTCCKNLAIYLDTDLACNILSEIVRLMLMDKINYVIIFSKADTSSDLYFNYLQYGNVFFIRGKHKFFGEEDVAMQVTVLDSIKFLKRRMDHYLECPMETDNVRKTDSYQESNPMKMLYGYISLSATVR